MKSSQANSENFLWPDWPAPAPVRAVCTTRVGGISRSPYASLNLGDHVGDDPRVVAQNRAWLRGVLNLPADPSWLLQVHGADTVDAAVQTRPCQADAAYTDRPGVVCAVLTADCLPLLLCDRVGTRVAAVHAGWRGLAGGVIERALESFSAPGSELMAWLGPAIGPRAFEVGEEVRAEFVAHDAVAAAAFQPARAGHWYADLYTLARQRLVACAVTAVYGGEHCTYTDPTRFYSYRRDGSTGRMASLIWLDALPT